MDFQQLKNEIGSVKKKRERLIENWVRMWCSLESVTLKMDKERVDGGYYIDLADKIHTIVELEKRIKFYDEELLNYEMVKEEWLNKIEHKHDRIKYDHHLENEKPQTLAEKYELSKRQIYRIVTKK
jgi:hypothetical protein